MTLPRSRDAADRTPRTTLTDPVSTAAPTTACATTSRAAAAEIFDAPAYPKLHFIEGRYANDPTNWWVPNRACTEAMLRSAGFRIEAHPEAEVYLCSCGGRPAGEGWGPASRGAPDDVPAWEGQRRQVVDGRAVHTA